MPNHVTIKVTLTGPTQVLNEIERSHILNDVEPFLDFNSIIPMPVSMNITCPPRVEEQEIALQNQIRYGCQTWYEWSIENWGTKWNSYDFSHYREDDTLVMNFQTAWSLPDPVLLELTDLYPEIVLHLECVEEGGFFAGTLVMAHGQVVADDLSEDDDVWYEYCKRLTGYDPREDEDEDEENWVTEEELSEDLTVNPLNWTEEMENL